MTTSRLMPVYPAEQVADLTKIRISKSVVKKFESAPKPETRRMIIWHPGLSLLKQDRLTVAQDLFRIPQNLRSYWQFPMRRVAAEYYQVCMPAPFTSDLNAEKQTTEVAWHGERPCWASIASWVWLVHFLATKQSLGCGQWMRCGDRVTETHSAGLFGHYDRLMVGDLDVAMKDRRVHLASQQVPKE